MNRLDWERSKKRLRKLIQRGMEDVKELVTEASYLTDATSQVVKLDVDIHRIRTQIEKAHNRLGREVVRAASSQGAVKQTSQIKKLILELRSLEQRAQDREQQLRDVQLSWSAAKQAAKKSGPARTGRRKATPVKKTTKGKGPARRKSTGS